MSADIIIGTSSAIGKVTILVPVLVVGRMGLSGGVIDRDISGGVLTGFIRVVLEVVMGIN